MDAGWPVLEVPRRRREAEIVERAATSLAAARSQTAAIVSEGLTPRLVGIADESMQKRPLQGHEGRSRRLFVAIAGQRVRRLALVDPAAAKRSDALRHLLGRTR